MGEEELEEIELSSDEEDDDADVALVVMKRPPQTTKTVDMLELGDEDDGTYTFYYLELALEAKLQKKVNQLKEVMGKSKGEIKYDNKNTETIADGKEAVRWRQQFTGRRKRMDKDGEQHKKELFHAFRAAPEEELKEESLKKEGKGKVSQKIVTERTWYSQEAWEHGGLWIKNEEVKDESPAKKLKKEA